MTHADRLAWGWWKSPLPDTLGEKNNYVLTAEEIAEYAALLDARAKDMQADAARARLVARVIHEKRVSSYLNDAPSRPITLCDVLENSVTEAKHRLAIMQFLLRCTGKRVQQKRENENENDKP